jgi:cellobiose PTS system EIIB component
MGGMAMTDKKNILLVCSSGMSTSLLTRAMQKAADEENYPVSVLSAGVAGIEEKFGETDCILLAPQMRHRLDFLKDAAGAEGVPLEIIPQDVYGLMNGKRALEIAKKMIKG